MCIQKLLRHVLLSAYASSSFSWAAEGTQLSLAQEYVYAAKGVVADVMVTDIEMINDRTSLGTMQLKERIVAWRDGVPVREIFFNSNPEHAGVAKARFKILVENFPEQSLRVGEVVGTRQEMLEGKKCIVYETQQRKSQKVFLRSQIWVEEATGIPMKAVHEFLGIPMTRSLVHTLIFSQPERGKVLPLRLKVDATVSALFQSMRIVSNYHFVSWKKRADVSNP